MSTRATKNSALSLKNELLLLLPADELQKLLPHFQVMNLELAQVLFEAYFPVEYLYFPDNSMISLLSLTREGSSVEIAAIGYEGMAGGAALLGDDTVAYRAMVQHEGQAHVLSLKQARRFFKDLPGFQSVVLRYLHALLTEISQSAVCSTFHSAQERLARWLLAHRDRSGNLTFAFTHEFLAMMLGTRRETVTQTLNKFEKLGWISTSRGNVSLINQDQLETVACECYATVKEEYETMAGAFVR